MHTSQIILSRPRTRGGINQALRRCIDECHDCAQACTRCAVACLSESEVRHLVQCIRLDLDCADLCLASAALASRRTGTNRDILRRMLEICGDGCRICAEECERHAARHEHCRVCADACRTCERACREAASSIGIVH
ncbi:MAG: four-helix bundle copper-binding protein [Reyranella sp.]|uniref:four-helix bundle copper-binding protein n=1 Tax=Reyranella sp. TaxID=1929291 RepID=UPI003D0D37CA